MKSYYSLCLFLLLACTQSSNRNDSAKESIQAPQLTTDSLIDHHNEMNIKVETYLAKIGFGYAIYVDGTKVIDQPSIPGLPGDQGFSTTDKAQKVGELVAHKLRGKQTLPTVTIQELDSLGALK